MPCIEWFNSQPIEYREQVLPVGTAKVSVEAGIAMGWREYVGDAGEIVAIDHFGESAGSGRPRIQNRASPIGTSSLG